MEIKNLAMKKAKSALILFYNWVETIMKLIPMFTLAFDCDIKLQVDNAQICRPSRVILTKFAQTE